MANPHPPPAASAASLFDTLKLSRATPQETLAAAANIRGSGVVRTPLIRLNYRRPDFPHLQIYLKLENLQPIGSFKVRGATNKIRSIDPTVLKNKHGNLIVSASAGNMGQGVAFAASSLGCDCAVVVPDAAPRNKLAAMEELGAEIIKVPYSRWWEIITTGGATSELGGRNHLFVHPVCDAAVVAGNGTVGLEILEDAPDVDAVFCSWGGGGCAAGIGSALTNAAEIPGCFPSVDGGGGGGGVSAGGDRRRAATVTVAAEMIAVEPETASPLCYSFDNNRTLTPLPDHPDPNAYRPSWIDGCGGKSVLRPMWDVAKDVLAGAWRVELEAAERALKVLAERNRIIAEGAGACPVAAAMYGPVKEGWKKVVAVVCGGCVDSDVLANILGRDFSEPYEPKPGFSFTRPLVHLADHAVVVPHPPAPAPVTRVLSAEEVCRLLPMAECIDAVEQALIAYSDGTGGMPLRQVVSLPFLESDGNAGGRTGFLAAMPSYTVGASDGDVAACKAFTVYPDNSQTGGRYSTHQGVLMLWNKGGNGELLLLADAHEVTKIRTAAASAVATRAILGRARCMDADTLAIVGTGEQARSHADAMAAVLPGLRCVKVWGRDPTAAAKLAEDVRARLHPAVDVTSCGDVASCVGGADVVCTVTSAGAPLLTEEHVGLLMRAGCHINAVGACAPQFHELCPEVFAASVGGGAGRIFTDSVEACLEEPGEVLAYLDAAGEGARANFIGIGDVLAGKDKLDGLGESRERPLEGFTIFKSLGIALEDLFAAKLIYGKTKNKS